MTANGVGSGRGAVILWTLWNSPHRNVQSLPLRRDGATRTAPCTAAAPRSRKPELAIVARVNALPALQVRPLADQGEAQLWREYVERYHHRRYTSLPGVQQRYLVTRQQRALGVAGFGVAPGRRLRATASSTGARPNAKRACIWW